MQLEVETAREQPRELLRRLPRAHRVAGEQRLADRAQVGARQRDQAAAELLQPVPAYPGLGALHVLGPAAAQELAQVQVALLVLHQQRQARGHAVGRVGQRVHPHVYADDGLDALAAAGLVELDGPEQVGQVGDGQRHLPVRLGRRRHVVDA